MEKRYAHTPHGRVHAVIGDGGYPVLLLHQGLRSAASFARLIPVLAPAYRGVAIDLPGCGNSEPASAGFGVRELAESVVSVMDELEIPRVHVLGNHTGATVAVEVAAGWPERVDRLVLFGYALVSSEEERQAELGERVAQLERDLEAAPDGSHLARWWSWMRLQVAFRRHTDGVVPSDSFTADELGFMKMGLLDMAVAADTFTPVYRAVFEYDSHVRLPLIEAPTLVIDGTGPFEPEIVQRSDDVAALIPNCETLTMEGEDGNIVWFRPEPLAEVMAGFFDRGGA